jgi:hypothetical protein
VALQRLCHALVQRSRRLADRESRLQAAHDPQGSCVVLRLEDVVVLASELLISRHRSLV